MKDTIYQTCLAALREELVPALGCTEPIALAYAAAKAADTLGCEPEHITVKCSGNIVKNVKGVKVPNAGGMRGIQAASILGALGGDSSRMLQVLEGVTSEHLRRTRELLTSGYCSVELLDGISELHIITEVFSQTHSALVEIAGSHTNIVRLVQDKKVLFQAGEKAAAGAVDRTLLSFDRIIDFADNVEMADVQDIIRQQIACNTRISAEGLKTDYGANVGKTLLNAFGHDVKTRANAAAAAGSDARMGGCSLPVVINSGSGNQGMTVSLPVIEFAREYGKSEEALIRALVVSNLIAIHQKSTVGKLSAYCGAVSAGCAAGVAIAYLMGESRQVMRDTLVNTLGSVAGIVCDGAKASCAAKIAAAVDAALLGYDMAVSGNRFQPEEGLIKAEIEDTIKTYGRLAKQGMYETDRTILDIMLEKERN